MYPDEFWQLAKYFQLRAPKDGFMDEDVPIDLTPKEMVTGHKIPLYSIPMLIC